jgi:hypothetical protein
MKRFPAFGLAIALGLILAPASAQQFKAGDIVVDKAWSPESPTGAMAGAGYLVIRNNGATPDRLIGGSADFAAVVIHEMRMSGGAMTMSAIKDGLEIPTHGAMALAPGGPHVTFMDLTHPLAKGQRVKATLTFEHAGPIPVEFSIGASDPAAGAKGADMKGMKM